MSLGHDEQVFSIARQEREFARLKYMRFALQTNSSSFAMFFFQLPKLKKDDLATIVYTSGTTGVYASVISKYM